MTNIQSHIKDINEKIDQISSNNNLTPSSKKSSTNILNRKTKKSEDRLQQEQNSIYHRSTNEIDESKQQIPIEMNILPQKLGEKFILISF